jgi:hypothetical protein
VCGWVLTINMVKISPTLSLDKLCFMVSSYTPSVPFYKLSLKFSHMLRKVVSVVNVNILCINYY